jgi:hypothetical protein
MVGDALGAAKVGRLPQNYRVTIMGRWGGRTSPHRMANDGGPGSGPQGGGEKTVSSNEASARIKAVTTNRLHEVLKHPNTDPKVKKLVEKELDERANRGKNDDLYVFKAGTHKGYGI